MIADTVASALALPCRVGWVPRSAETAVVISEYGPFTIAPVINSITAISSKLIPQVKQKYNEKTYSTEYCKTHLNLVILECRHFAAF